MIKKRAFVKLLICATAFAFCAYFESAKAFVRQRQRNEIRENILEQVKENVKKFSMTAKLQGTIESIEASSFTLKSSGGLYTVLIDDKTNLVRRFGAKSSLSEFSIGDTVNVVGKWTDEDKKTLKATLVRDFSIQKKNAAFIGTITAIYEDSFSINPLAQGRFRKGEKRVYTSQNCIYLNRKKETIKREDLKVGHTVRVSGGVLNRVENKIFDVSKVVDMTLPVIKPT